MSIPIIDLFAGPGGLGEGFSTLQDEYKERVFNIKLSVEKDEHAHETLLLRSFLRQFPVDKYPKKYYEFLEKGLDSSKLEDELYGYYNKEYKIAKQEAWKATLGQDSPIEVDKKIRIALGNKSSNWVLIGGPPCQAFSNAGRSRVGGIANDDHRVFLYKEYLRIIAVHQPAIFVMENVKGLLSAELNGEKIFRQILIDLKNPSSVFKGGSKRKYRIHSLVTESVEKDSDYLIRSEEYGVPQKRHRVILLGIRDDIEIKPGTLKKSERIELQSVIGDLPPVRSGLYRSFLYSEEALVDGKLKKKRKYQNIKDSFEEWEKLVDKFRLELIEKMGIVELIQPKEILPKSVGTEYQEYHQKTIYKGHKLHNWYADSRLKGIIHHVSRGHLTQDLKRYLFASLYTHQYNKFPRMEDYKRFGEDLLPDHASAESGKFNDRFRVQVKDQPATTVTSHISKDGHYFIHYDPLQCRSLTVREAARIQTFPDNYFFCGSRTQKFHQVGNAVPPYLAFQIAEIVSNVMKKM